MLKTKTPKSEYNDSEVLMRSEIFLTVVILTLSPYLSGCTAAPEPLNPLIPGDGFPVTCSPEANAPFAVPTDTAIPTITPLPSGPCDNPLMSLRPGNWWRYQSTSPVGSSQQVFRVREWNEEHDLNAVIEMENMDTGVVTSDWVTCLDGGGIEDFPLFFLSMQMGDYVDGVFNTYYDSGIYSPGYPQFSTNHWILEWDAEYLTEQAVCFTKIWGTGGLCINQSSPIELMFSTRGEYEPITVPAGNFPQALKVIFLFRVATTLSFTDIATSAPLTVQITQWYAPYNGLLRSQVDLASVALMPGEETVVPVESVIELVEYSISR